MEEIKINKAWYEGLIKIIKILEDSAITSGKQILLGQVSYLKGYAESLQTQFGDDGTKTIHD